MTDSTSTTTADPAERDGTPSTTPGATPTAVNLSPDQRFNFGGTGFTLESVAAEPDPAGDTSKLKVTLLAATETVRPERPPTMKLIVNDLDVPLSVTMAYLNPGAKERVTYTGSLDNVDLERLGDGRLVVGEDSSNQASVPLATGPDPKAVRHPLQQSPAALGPINAVDGRAGNVTITVGGFWFGASNPSGVPAAADSTSVGIGLTFCVTTLDQQFGASFTYPDGTTKELHSAVYTASDNTRLVSGTGVLVGTKCPATESFQFWGDVPLTAQGSTITVNIVSSFGKNPNFATFPVEVPRIDESTLPT